MPLLSTHFLTREPSSIRLVQIEFMKRTDGVTAINTAIGNVSLPMHPAMQKRLFALQESTSPFAQGVVKYSSTVGESEANQTFMHLLETSGFSTKDLYSQVTDGGSQAMELMLLGVCGPAGTDEKPLLVIEAAYSNYQSFAERIGRKIVSVRRTLEPSGKFSLPDFAELEAMIEKYHPGALLIIPYDNPTGQFYDQETINHFAQLCVKHDLWLVSDEAYRELFYVEGKTSSVWGISEGTVPGITGRRMSIESASKVWNACGLRIGGLITDNQHFHEKSVAENTANLCANVVGQYVFGAILHESKESLTQWYAKQREYYRVMAQQISARFTELEPQIIVSHPDAALYFVIDVREVVQDVHPEFDVTEFVLFCAREGKVQLNGEETTLLVAPMTGFYSEGEEKNPGRTQMRIAYVETPEKMALVPELLVKLLQQYLSLS